MQQTLATIFFVMAACLATTAAAQTIAFTFDDGPHLSATPRLSPQARNQAMIDALAKHDVKATLFVTAGNGADRPEGRALARAWGRFGKKYSRPVIQNHSLPSARLTTARQILINSASGISPLARLTAQRTHRTFPST
jgi:hypothetical protein